MSKGCNCTWQYSKESGERKKSVWHRVFPGGHQSKYSHCSTLLNFSDQTGTGVFKVIWPYTSATTNLSTGVKDYPPKIWFLILFILYFFVEWCFKIMDKKFQSWRCDGNFCDIPCYNNDSVQISFNSKAGGRRPTAGPEGPPAGPEGPQ